MTLAKCLRRRGIRFLIDIPCRKCSFFCVCWFSDCRKHACITLKISLKKIVKLPCHIHILSISQTRRWKNQRYSSCPTLYMFSVLRIRFRSNWSNFVCLITLSTSFNRSRTCTCTHHTTNTPRHRTHADTSAQIQDNLIYFSFISFNWIKSVR